MSASASVPRDYTAREDPRLGVTDVLLMFAVLIWGLGICLHYGRLGFMPLDQSIVYDGAWRMVSGQVPFRDFFFPAGLVPILMQAGVFRLLGVTWFAYCLHAAVLNGLFAVLAYVLLRRFALFRPAAMVFALLTGVVFYPPFGVPAADQHAFFFALAALTVAVEAARTTHRGWRFGLWAIVPVLVMLAVLSKQNPGGMALPLVVFAVVWGGRRGWRSAGLGLLIGAIAACGLLWWATAAWGIDRDKFVLFFWRLAADTGESRLARFGPDWIAVRLLTARSLVLFTTQAALLVMLTLASRSLTTRHPRLARLTQGLLIAAPLVFAVWLARTLPHPYMAAAIRAGVLLVVGLCIVTAGVCLALAVTRRPAVAALAQALGRGYDQLLLAQLLLAICLLGLVLINNDVPTCFPFLFISAGLVYGALSKGWPDTPRFRFQSWAAVGLLGLCLAEGAYFNYWVNARRFVHEFRGDRPQPIDGARLAPSLSYLKFALAQRTRDPYTEIGPRVQHEDFVRLTEFLHQEPGNFFLLGDSSILYAATNRPSVNPCLWFHYGLAMPRPGTPEFDWYESRLLENIRHYRCRFIILEGERTFMEARLRDFPGLEALIRQRELARTRFGPFEVIELRSE